MYDSLFLSDVEEGMEFHLVTGQTIKNIYELVGALKTLSQENFSYHCNAEKDDFGAWITHSLHNSMLGNILSRVKDQKKYIRIIEKAIHHKELESQARLHVVKVSKMWIENNKKKLSEIHQKLKDFENKINEKEKEASIQIEKNANYYVEKLLSKHKQELKKEVDNTIFSIKEIKNSYEQKLKEQEKEYEKIINDYISKNAENEVKKIVSNNKQEFIDILSNEKSFAKTEIENTVKKELEGITEKFKEKILLEINNILEKEKELEKALEERLALKEQEFLKNASLQFQKEFSQKLAYQRDILDNELAKTLKFNKDFVEKFEEEIRTKEKKLSETISGLIDKELKKKYRKISETIR
ncbi:MAG: hypothetical protein KatS3mg002_1094 [Candidatus Woesearchaeota archaeon]|nr:MAG: hypothetical protein KatS3mg002_1094 [Candidatus Woesearchaeota archaeon]